MKRAINNKGSIYDYLEPFLETGNAEEITLARKQYWRNYKSKWRKEKRLKQKEFTISFTDKEFRIINQNANKHNRSCTRFIKEASISYCTQNFLFPDLATLNHIRELLALNYNAIQQLSEESNMVNLQADECMMRMADLEKKILTLLQNPTVLE